MRLRNFLIFIGLWVALLPYLGFSISSENVLFSITGFVLIVSSFYIAAVEDKHRHQRIIKEDTLNLAEKRVSNTLKQIRETANQKLRRKQNQSPEENKQTKPITQEDISLENKFTSIENSTPKEQDVFVIEEDDGRPRIRKAVSDVRIKADSFDDGIS